LASSEFRIEKILSREVLDSRANPTVQVDLYTKSGFGRFSVPSGASKGHLEALELRDGDKHRYAGLGVQKAVENVNKILGPKILGMDSREQAKIDRVLVNLDGTENKGKLGANAILGVSIAVSRASADTAKSPLYRILAGGRKPSLPMPLMNIINGGKHAGNDLSFQEFMVIPAGFRTFKDALRGIDAAADSFYDQKARTYKVDGRRIDSDKLLDLYVNLQEKFPLKSIEDPFHDEDFENFSRITKKLGAKIQIVGDDLFVTNIKRVDQGIRVKAANALLVKINQIGTLTETIEAVEMARKADYGLVLSHRSGETEDNSIADISVGLATGQIKAGAPARGERTSKYNRLLLIEEELASSARFYGPEFLKSHN